jgi:hypothetical protein
MKVLVRYKKEKLKVDKEFTLEEFVMFLNKQK